MARSRVLPCLILIAGSLAAPGDPGPAEPASPPGGPLFTDEAQASGLDFVHFNGMSGELYLPEITGSGGALFDYDGDGDLDVYLVQGRMLGPGKQPGGAVFPPEHPLPLSDRLYRNDLTMGPDGSRTLRFTDVTEESGLAAIATGYGMGVATGDYDNDGRVDLYVANYGSNQLLRNQGPGPDGATTFRDVTAEAGADDARWTVAATFFDYDGDGWLDLYVLNYVDFEYARHRKCNTVSGAPDYCSPLAYNPVEDRLLRNLGPGPDGVVRFEDVTGRAGIAGKQGNGLGVVAADLDGDGWPDLFVANDQMANFLWINQEGPEGRRFREDAVLAGVAVNREGEPEASMGVVAADFDGDGDEDLFLAHLTGETNTFYRNDGGGLFLDETARSGLGQPSMSSTGFGVGVLDYDGDGRLDLFVASGAVQVIEAQARAEEPYPLRQRNQLFRNLGGGRFTEVVVEAGPALELSEVSRGVAVGDVDNDGDPDLLVVNNSGPVRLLLNRVGQDRPWVGLRLVGRDGKRDMLGARVGLFRKGAPPLWRRVHTDGS
ncbi:MAG TPA: VCBS repeat-containing protein, partial [Thermoanaerobaculia bacterium]|nr:VCBS repeat-containing protein [Thermoanaerobaculia bacterium]